MKSINCHLHFSGLIILFLTTYVHCGNIFITENVTNICSTQYKTSKQIHNFEFNCSVSNVVSVDPNHPNLPQPKPGCTDFDYRSLIVHNFGRIRNTSFICNSNYAITVNIKFEDGNVLKDYLNMSWSRKVVDFTDKSTYKYVLQIFPPHYFVDNMGGGDAVWYTISSLQYPSETIDVLWFTTIEKDYHISWAQWVYWMEDIRDLENLIWSANGDAVYIPCVSPFKMKLEKLGVNNTKYNLRYASNNFGIFLQAKQNESDLPGKYRCTYRGNIGIYDSTGLKNSLYEEFSIVATPSSNSSSYKIYFNESNVFQSKVAFVNVETKQQYNFGDETSAFLYRVLKIDTVGLRFELQCQNRGYNETFVPSFHVPDSSLQRYDKQCNYTMNSTIDYLVNQTLNTAVCLTSEIDINQKIIYWCLEKPTNKIIAGWKIANTEALKKHRSIIERYEYVANKHEFVCYGQYGSYLQNNIILKEESCSNPLTCKLLERLFQKNTNVNDKRSCFRKNTILSSVGMCAVTKLSQKGVIYCKSLHEINSQKKTEIFNVYFMGLDKRFYLGISKDPPKEAIIQMKMHGSHVKTMINHNPVNFTFICEAHSFYFEEGIQWLFEYANGTQQHITADHMYNLPNVRGEENTNPFSTVAISVPNKNIRRIVCAAPRLSVLKLINLREWVFVGLNISIFDGKAPQFVDTGSKYYFDIGEWNKEIKCQTIGLPTPQIHWSAISGQNLSKDDVADLSLYSVLRFPIYDERNEGDYLCTATNAVGNVSKIISVHTKDIDSSLPATQLALVLTAVFLILILVFATSFYWYIRKSKMKQSLDMEDILHLLYGQTSSSVDENGTNPLQAPYDHKWDLENHSFCIDKCKILGCGEFGIVYKGTIAKLNMDVAFKSLKSERNRIHLKSLVSEFKLLLFIGNHPNIVELYGAYTQEIKKGLIYVAIEFCALGSLKSYLRSNKGRFQKCPFLTSYFENSTFIPASDFQISDSSNHTVKYLLKWCSEIAGAMDHLFSKKVVHGDLATRNILLTADWSAKLTDFGLSRLTYYSDDYVKKGKDPLPWRWLALESLLKKVFNVKTDVWAFGITLWEIFSLGEIPYPGLSHNKEFVTELENGFRNSKAKYASTDLHNVMTACWDCKADERPSFASLSSLFQNALHDSTFQINVEDMKPIKSIEKETIEYVEAEELQLHLTEEKMDQKSGNTVLLKLDARSDASYSESQL